MNDWKVNPRLFVWGMLLALLTLSAGGEGWSAGSDAVVTVSQAEFGLAFVNSAEAPRRGERIRRGVTAGARLDRFPLYWHLIETEPGAFDWTNADRAIRDDEAHGLGVLAVLLGVPSFYFPYQTARAQAQPTLPPVGGSILRREPAGAERVCGPPPPKGLFEPVFTDGSDEPGPGKTVNPANPWARFVSLAVQRYRPGGAAGTHVRYWEIWNEPDLCQFWNGSPQEYARLLKVAYLVIKHYDPQATVLWGGLAHYEQPDFLTVLVNTLAQDPLAPRYNGFFDAAASHQYSASWLGYRYTKRVRDVLASVGWGHKPVWITESGVPVCDDYPGPPCPSPYRANPLEQAAYIWQNVAYTRMAGGGPIFHFQLHDDCGNVVAPNSPDGFGLRKNEPDSYCSPANAEPRPAYTAFQVVTRYLSRTEFLWADVQDGTVRRVAFYDPATRERRLMVWNVGGEPTVGRVPATGDSARRVALDGSEAVITPVNGEYQLALTPATNQNYPDSSLYTIGGPPFLLVERDTRPPEGQVDLPPVVPLTFTVKWQVRDLGSGVASVAVWVQREGEAWQQWLTGQPARGEATFQAPAPGRYRFGVVAADRAGNGHTAPTGVVETLATDRPVTVQVRGQVVDLRGRPVPRARVWVGNALAYARADGRFALSVPAGRWDVRVGDRVVRRGLLFTADTTLTLLFPATSRVLNGDFEDELTHWTPGGSTPATVETWPGTQDRALRLAPTFVPDPCGCVPGEDGSVGGNSTVSQQVRVPDDQPALALWYRVESEETEPGHDKFEVIVVDEQNRAHYVYVQETSSEARFLFLDLAPFAGQQVRLILNLYQSSPQRPTTAWVDLVTLGRGVPPDVPPVFETFLPLVSR